MGLFTKDIKTMNDLFVHQLQDILLRREAAREGAAENGRKGNRQAAQAGVS